MDNAQCFDAYSIQDNLLQKPHLENILHQQSISILDVSKNLHEDNSSLKNLEKNICLRKFLMCVCVIMLLIFITNILLN